MREYPIIVKVCDQEKSSLFSVTDDWLYLFEHRSKWGYFKHTLKTLFKLEISVYNK